MTLLDHLTAYASAPADPFEAGRIVGRVVGASLLSVGIAVGVGKCVQIARRPETNGKAAYALLVALVMWVLGAWMGVLRDLGSTSVAIALGFSATVFAGSIVSIVLVVIAAIEMRAARPRYRQGKGQAIAASILSAILLGAVTIGFAIGVKRGREVPEHYRYPDASPEGSVASFPDASFRLTMPGSPWQRIDPKAVNPLANVALYRVEDSIFFMVIAESTAADASSDIVAEVAKANVKARSPDARILSDDLLDSRGLRGRLVRVDNPLGDHTYRQVIWALAHRGHVYQLMTWGEVERAAVVEDEAKAMIERFDVIQRDGPIPEPEPAAPTRL